MRLFVCLCLLSFAACEPTVEPRTSEPGEPGEPDQLEVSYLVRDASTPLGDAGTPDVPPVTKFAVGVNTHNYLKPFSYGYTAADGADRMGNALRKLNVKYARGALIGDEAYLDRLHEFGVTSALLGLDAKSYGKPFDPAKLRAALGRSVSAARRLGMEVIAEGLNEWDLFRTRSYNDGVEPAGVSEAEFVRVTQAALYQAAHEFGIKVLGPSVGHPFDQKSIDFFPDVSAYVDIVNMHFYFGTDPDNLPVAQYVANHAKFQGSKKPVFVTETGVSAYAGVSEARQADIIARGFKRFLDSGLITAAYNYELLDGKQPGLNTQTWTFLPDDREYHFGLFRYSGAIKPAGTTLAKFIVEH
jgi:hypothetical protein